MLCSHNCRIFFDNLALSNYPCTSNSLFKKMRQLCAHNINYVKINLANKFSRCLGSTILSVPFPLCTATFFYTTFMSFMSLFCALVLFMEHNFYVLPIPHFYALHRPLLHFSIIICICNWYHVYK